MIAAAPPRRWHRIRVIAVVAGVVLLSPVLLVAVFARAFSERR